MKIAPALAAIEFDSVPSGIFAADAVLKKSPISLLRAGTIGSGRYLLVFAGSTASVEEAAQEAMYHGGNDVADSTFLPDIAPALYDGLLGERRTMGEGPILILETPTVSACLEATERALKGVPVELLELRAGDPRMAGKGLAILQGDLYDIEEAESLATAALEARGGAAKCRILSAPTKSILDEIASSTRFNQAEAIKLAGENPEG